MLLLFGDFAYYLTRIFCYNLDEPVAQGNATSTGSSEFYANHFSILDEYSAYSQLIESDIFAAGH